MTLVRQTAAKAEQALQQPDPDPEDKPVRTPDHVLQFVRLARLVNHSMAFETRIANDDLLRRPAAFRAGAPRPQPRPDGRRPLLRQALDRATKSIPDRARRRREIDDHLEAELAADPDQTRHPAEILQIIAQAADINADLKYVSDEFLDYKPNLAQTEIDSPYQPGRRQNL